MKKNDQPVALLPATYHDDLKKQLREKTTQYGDFSFDSNDWYCSKRHKNADSKTVFSMRFNGVDNQYRESVKYFALMKTNAIRTIQAKIYSIGYFLDYFTKYHSGKGLHEINRKIASKFESYLRDEKRDQVESAALIYAAVHDFFTTMSDFPEFPSVIPTKRTNPFKRERKRIDEKYIPKEVLKKFDKALKDESIQIPLEYRTLYWIIRSFPNRVTEVLSLKSNCLKALFSYYVLQIPTYKQNGGYDREEIKTIPVNNSGHGEYIVGLIRKLEQKRKDMIEEYGVQEREKGYLLLTTNHYPLVSDNKLTWAKKGETNALKLITPHLFTAFLSKIAEVSGIKDDSGQFYIPDTHQFRHNAITDRLYSGGYTVEQATKLTGHKGTAMITNSYSHQIREKHKETILKMADLKEVGEAPVEFQGRIMNLDEKTVSVLSNNPRAYLTWEANSKKGVGMCSDILGCNPKGTSVHFECYSCDWFVPKAEYLEDYKAEKEYWNNIAKSAEGNPKRAAHFENAIRNVTLLERIVEICENGIKKSTGGQ